MKCPSCGNEQADGWLSCQKCHIIFARWKPAADTAAIQENQVVDAAGPTRKVSMFAGPAPKVTRFQDAVAAPHPRPALSWVVYLALILPFAVALYLLLNPKGRPVVPGSYRDSRNHFALRAPEGWLALNKENFDAIVRRYGSQLPAKITETIAGSGLAVSFVRLGQAGDFSPFMNVVIVKKAPPPINEKSKQEAAKAIAAGYAVQFPDYRQESVKLIEVDSLRSLEIISTASLPLRSTSSGVSGYLGLRTRQVLVPGKNLAYILTFSDIKEAGADAEAEFQVALDSFRVLKRPPRFSPLLNRALIGGLIAAIFFLFNAMLLSLGGARIR